MDRYVSLWKSPLNLYCDNCPVLIAAGALLKDSQTGGILAQLKLKNLTDNAIKAVKVKIISLSVSGEEMPQTQEYQYLDLSVAYNTDFGSKQPIMLPDATARSFAVVCQSVVFTDGTSWQNETESRCVPANFPYGVRQRIMNEAIFSQFIRNAEMHEFWQRHTNEPLWQEDKTLQAETSKAYIQQNPELLQEINGRRENIKRILTAPRLAGIDFTEEEKAFIASSGSFREKLAESEKNYQEAQQKKAEEKKQQAEKKRKKAIKQTKKILSVVLPVAAVVIICAVLVNTVILPHYHYKQAMKLFNNGSYDEAIAAFTEMEGYKDSEEIICEINYLQAKVLLESGDGFKAFQLLSGLGDYKDAKDLITDITNSLKDSIVAGYAHSVRINTDGTVNAFGANSDGRSNTSGWTDIIAVSAGFSHTVGLKKDGTVVATGSNACGQCNVSDWTDIKAINTGAYHTVAIKANGTVVAVGKDESGQCNVSEWEDIVAVSAGRKHTVALKSDGTTIAVGSNEQDQCTVSEWKDIVSISAGGYHTLGLKKDGTVVAVGNNDNSQCDVSDWENIIQISAGDSYSVGLKADGTVVVTGDNKFGQCNVSDWNNIVAISAGFGHTIGLKTDGTVVGVGSDTFGQLGK